MGVALADLIQGEELAFSQLQDMTIAVDAFNFLYQFLASIRGPDGSPLTNAKGEVTSHIVGLLSRTLKLKSYGAKLIYILMVKHQNKN